VLTAKQIKSMSPRELKLAELRAKHADIIDRYNQIARIVLAGGAGMPTATQDRP